MTRAHQLEANLRTLSLSGMLDTLDARLGQAQAGELGHLEFLQVLCQDEIGRRDAAALDRRLRAARFEQAATIEDYDFGYNPKIPAAHIRDLATLRFIDNGESVVLHGPVGVGKSMIAQASVTPPAGTGTASRSPKHPGSSLISPAGTPTAAGRPACAAGPARRYSSWMTSPCASSRPPKQTTFTS